MFPRGPSTYPSCPNELKISNSKKPLESQRVGFSEEKKQIASKQEILGLRFQRTTSLFHKIYLNKIGLTKEDR
jgi:hypothetical protein